MTERILVGVDGSSPSRAALVWALKRAHITGAPVTIEHVVDEEWGQLGSDYAHEQTQHAAVLLHEAALSAEASPGGIEVDTRLTHGSVAQTLVNDAGRDALLVIGTHKTGYVHGRVLGTMSVVVAATARCAVAIIPEQNLSVRRSVVVGVTEGEGSRAAVVFGAAEASARGEELQLIHSADDPARTERGRALLAEAAALAESVAPVSVIRSRISRRRPSDSLLDASRSAALLVLGGTRGPIANAGFLGSVTHEVLMNINCPVLIARPH